MEIQESYKNFINENNILKHNVSHNVSFHNKDLILTFMPLDFDKNMVGFSVIDAFDGDRFITGNIAVEDKYVYLYMIDVENKRQGWATDFWKFMVKNSKKYFNKPLKHSKIHSVSGNKWKQSLNEEIIGKLKGYDIYKNPPYINRFDKGTRALLTQSGDLYVIDDNYNTIHYDIYNELIKLGELDKSEKLYIDTIAWQKSNRGQIHPLTSSDKRNLYLADSYDIYDKEEHKVKRNIDNAIKQYNKHNNTNINFKLILVL